MAHLGGAPEDPGASREWWAAARRRPAAAAGLGRAAAALQWAQGCKEQNKKIIINNHACHLLWWWWWWWWKCGGVCVRGHAGQGWWLRVLLVIRGTHGAAPRNCTCRSAQLLWTSLPFEEVGHTRTTGNNLAAAASQGFPCGHITHATTVQSNSGV